MFSLVPGGFCEGFPGCSLNLSLLHRITTSAGYELANMSTLRIQRWSAKKDALAFTRITSTCEAAGRVGSDCGCDLSLLHMM